MNRFLFLFLAASTLAVLPAYSADPPPRKVTVTGTATIKVTPDEMNWSVQVSIDDATLAKAKDRHDSSLTGALKYINSLGSSVKDLQTGGIRIQKNNYASDNSEAAKRPFNCSTQFTFTLTDFSKYGPIADALAKFDGIQVQDVDYASSKAQATSLEALKQALADAHDKANALAVAATCYIDRPLEIQEGTENNPRPMMRMMTAAAPGGTPAAVPGQLEISSSVTVTYDMFYH